MEIYFAHVHGDLTNYWTEKTSESYPAIEKDLKEYYRRVTGKPFPKFCMTKDCENVSVIGGHVWLRDSNEMAILPSCRYCRQNKCYVENDDKTMWVKAKEEAIPARLPK